MHPAVLQLNIEGTTVSKISVVKHLAHKTKSLIIFFQETHCTCVDKLVIPNFALAGLIPSRKNTLATFFHESLSWTLASQSPEDSEIEWLCMDFAGLKIISVYKPPSSRLLTIPLPVFPSPCMYAGDFNCQHVQWGYRANTSNRDCLVEWVANINLMLLHNPKAAANFTSGCWNIGTNPDLTFVSAGSDNRFPDRCVLEKFPLSQHQPSLITAAKLVAPILSEPVKR